MILSPYSSFSLHVYTHTHTHTHMHTHMHIHTHTCTPHANALARSPPHTPPHTQGAPELISYTACEYIFRWESIHACRLTLPSTPVSKTVCNITDPVSHSTYDFRTLVQQEHFVINKTNSNTRYHLKLCGSASSPPTGCDANTGICVTDSNGGNPKTILYADHKISITSRLPYEFEIIYPSGVRCGSDSSKKWTAFVTLQCDARGGTQQPEFVSDDHCELQLQWRNSSFCLGDRACVATDPHTRFIFNLDGLYSQTWTVSSWLMWSVWIIHSEIASRSLGISVW